MIKWARKDVTCVKSATCMQAVVIFFIRNNIETRNAVNAELLCLPLNVCAYPIYICTDFFGILNQRSTGKRIQDAQTHISCVHIHTNGNATSEKWKTFFFFVRFTSFLWICFAFVLLFSVWTTMRWRHNKKREKQRRANIITSRTKTKIYGRKNA